MELSPSWEDATCAEFSNILWNPKVHYRVQKSPPLVTVRSQINATPSCLRFILILSTHIGLDLPSGLFSFGFPINISYAFLFVIVHATCPAHLILFDLIILITFAKQYKL
jgi:hypothetical protein